MATVYLAEDLKHHRKVALKVLRPEIAATLGAGRFAREIEVAARLQHPNILPLLDSGEAAGFFFYVMPFVEGESLRDRLARSGEFAIPDAVRILVEVADALSHAHAHGVVHRDIKPDNVLLSGRHALVADFGVAKAVTEATGRQMLTSAGVALGTPAYMAPEQAVADPHQDHRVDIYALGVLGYELLTGRAPFSATTAQEMLAAHVTTEPEPLEQYRPTVSPALAAVVMRCLAKKPADRWQTADEVLAALEPLATPSGGTTPTQTRPMTALARLPRWAPWVAGAAAVAVVALALGQLLKSRPLNITVSDITQVTSDPGVEFQPAISPDGNQVAYVAGPTRHPRLFVRSTVNAATGGAMRLADTSPGYELFPSWSPDGQSVRFNGCPNCTWKEVGMLGGAVRTAPLPPGAAQVVAWSSDGARLAFVRGDTIFATPAGDAAPRPVVLPTKEHYYTHSLAWSPDGRLIAYVNGNPVARFGVNLRRGSSIWVASTAGGEPQPVTTNEHLNASPTWLDARHLLFVSNRDGPSAAYVVEVGPRGSRGEPRLVPGVSEPHSISYSIRAGKLAYAKLTLRENIRSYPMDRRVPVSIRDGRAVTTGDQVIETEDVAPDGRQIVYAASIRGTSDLYEIPVTGGVPVPLTSSPGNEAQPQCSPDGREIAFYATAPPSAQSPGTVSDIMVMPAAGGTPKALTHGPGQNEFPAWSPTGREIAFHRSLTGLDFTVMILSRDSAGGSWHEARPLTNRPCRHPVWAPDGSGVLCPWGSRLALISPQGTELWQRDLGLTQSSLGLVPRYSKDGRTVFVVGTQQDGRSGIWAISDAGRGEARLAVAFDDPTLEAQGWGLSVGPDRIYLAVAQYESDIWVAKLKY